MRFGRFLPSNKPKYVKPHKTFPDQVRLLVSRGLTIPDEASAETLLTHVNYYRLSAYSRVFYQRTGGELFVPGTTFNQIRGLYEFDRSLRGLISAALEPIEVSIRTAMAYQLGQKYGAFGHVDRKNFRDNGKLRHSEWLDQMVKETARSNEVFIRHFEKTYREFPMIPVWGTVEIMSFGMLSKMFQMLPVADKQVLAAPLGIHHDVLGSWLHTIVYVRNMCAHHARLWDRDFRVQSAIPKNNPDWKVRPRPKPSRLGAFLFVLNGLSSKSAFPHFDLVAWRTDVETLIGKSDYGVPGFLDRMGLSADWMKHPLWK